MESQFFLVMSGLFSGFSVSVTSFLGERVYIYIYVYIHTYFYIFTSIYIYTYKCIRSQCRNCRNYKFGNLKLIFFAILRLGGCCGGWIGWWLQPFLSPEADRLVHRWLRRNTAGRGKSSEPISFFCRFDSFIFGVYFGQIPQNIMAPT